MTDSIAKIVAEMRELSRTDAGASSFGARRMKEWANRLEALGWRDISSAPIKDFSPTYWYMPHSPRLLLCDPASSAFIGTYGYTKGGKGRWRDDTGRVRLAAHWQPLPAPPEG